MDGGAFQNYLTDHLANLGTVKTNTLTQEPEEKYKQKFNIANLLPMILMLLSDEDFMGMIGGLFGGGDSGSSGLGSSASSGLGGGASGVGSIGGF